MTLGRTASNAIKIKTDGEGGGLRAVECGCCSSCEATCSCSPFCGFTQLKITPPPPDWPTPFIIVNGCNDGSFFCDIFAWSFPTILSVSVDTDTGIALFASDYAGNGSKPGGTPFGTYSNGITIEPYVP